MFPEEEMNTLVLLECSIASGIACLRGEHWGVRGPLHLSNHEPAHGIFLLF